jgi:hypothetical protein
MSNLRLRVHALQGHQNHRRNVDSYARQRESHSRCERIVSTKFLPIATRKQNGRHAIHVPKITKMVRVSKNPKEKTHSNLNYSQGGKAPRLPMDLTLGHSISIPYVQPISIPLLVMASCVLFFFMSSAASLAAKPTCFGFAASSLTTPLGRGPTGRTPHC